MSAVDQQLLDTLKRALGATSLEVSDDKQALLVRYVMMMHKWNKAYNLTSVRDPQQMVIKHLVDSVVVAPHLDGDCYIDVGTGPGLPGIPLAIMHPDKHFTLLDSLGKRVRFMKQVGFELGLKNISPVQSRVEQFQSDIRLDGVLSRAFASIKDMLHWCQHLVDSEGAFLALKGQYPEQELEQMPAGFMLESSIRLDVPELDGERHLLVIRKQASN